MSRPVVSVAMATFEGERFLRPQLDSIYAQTWPDLEVVVSDDRSSDGTTAILDEYANRHGLRYSVAPRRLGLVGNFERAISLCRGDLVTLSDQDDVWRPRRIERLVAALSPDYALAYCGAHHYLDIEGPEIPARVLVPIRDWARRHGTGRVSDRLLAENWVVSHGMLFRREVAEAALPVPPHQPYHDAWLALVASTIGGGIRFVDEPLVIYRRHPASYTFTVTPTARGRAFGERWHRRCRAEIARIEDAGRLPLDRPARETADRLLRYYRSGLAGRLDPRAFRLGLRLAPLFSTQHAPGDPLRMAVKGLIGGLLSASHGQGAANPDGAEEA